MYQICLSLEFKSEVLSPSNPPSRSSYFLLLTTDAAVLLQFVKSRKAYLWTTAVHSGMF